MTKGFGELRRLGAFARARAGVAAVEFAFILPLMLVLYFGLAVLGQGLEVGRKVQSASRTLADLTSQQLPSTANCTPCVVDADLTDFYAGAQLVLTPFAATTLSATLSEVIFYNATSSATSGCCKARVMWSVGFGASPTLRACGVAGLTAVANGVNGAGVMPVGNYPGGAQGAAVAAGTANSTAYYVIVADVTYQFKPGYDFKLFNWGSDAHGGAGYTISQTTYMIPRYSATKPIKWTPGGVISSANYRSCVSGVDYYAP
ncbi:Flp pilus assembly protein TadG [Rhodoblastus acidophilus]|uniref:Flp pilus assembly protein TadG n=1 Tax=Rhodoblastus acidophilus TaxID=1074 RepID=A0A212R240_RHOAC|nr:TadE/TadG family type IV pilus assembly protein [Rhodoblastus acidophilus]SNB66072.1 Flp pilus assembly protein TadG [Rhodoblastus acidophilus]